MVYIPNVLSLLRQYIPSSKTGRIVLVATGSTIVVLSVVGVYLRRRRRKYSPTHSDESVDYNRLRGATIMSPCANSTGKSSKNRFTTCFFLFFFFFFWKDKQGVWELNYLMQLVKTFFNRIRRSLNV